MKRISLSFFILLSVTGTAIAQEAAKAAYIELGGPGLASINYDMRVQKKEDGLGFRVGIGGFSVNEASGLFIPLGLNYLLGKDKKNYFEFGGGITFVSFSDPLKTDDNSVITSTSFGHLYFGYRLQPKDGGFLFRAGITPVFNKDGFVPYYGGISFGYKF